MGDSSQLHIFLPNNRRLWSINSTIHMTSPSFICKILVYKIPYRCARPLGRVRARAKESCIQARYLCSRDALGIRPSAAIGYFEYNTYGYSLSLKPRRLNWTLDKTRWAVSQILATFNINNFEEYLNCLSQLCLEEIVWCWIFFVNNVKYFK